MKLFTLAIALFGATNSNAAIEIDPHIVNGENVNVGIEYPSFASLFYDRIDYDNYYGIRPFCGATLLTNQYVLTAAHCIYNDKELQLFISVVPQLQNEKDFPHSINERVMVNEYYYPDSYNHSTLHSDIAILKLAYPLSRTYGYANLATNTDEPNYRIMPSEAFYAIGHGNTQTGYDNTDEVQSTQLSYVDNKDCDIYNVDTSENLCMTGASTITYDNATCQGDSGGPLFWQGKQVGITSFGPLTCGDPRIIPNSVFTEVSRHENWIQSVLAGKEQPKISVLDEERRNFLKPKTSSGGSGGSLGATYIFLLSFMLFSRIKYNE